MHLCVSHNPFSFCLQRNDRLRAIEKRVEVEAGLGSGGVLEVDQVTFDPDPVPTQSRQNSGKCLPRHPKLGGDQALLEWKPDRLICPHVFGQPQQIAAHTLFG